MHEFGCHFSGAEDPSPLQSRDTVLITVEESADKEPSVVLPDQKLLHEQETQPPVVSRQAANLQQPPLGSPQAARSLQGLRALATQKLKDITATKKQLAEQESDYLGLLLDIANYK